MDRPRFARTTLAVTIGLAALTAGCAQAPEREVIERYFSASRMRDNTTLANFATVAFRPSEEGVVQNFDVVNVAPEETRPLRIRELAEAYEQARAADEEFTKRKREYQDANLEAIDRVLRAEREGSQIRGADAEVQAAWTKWRDETNEHSGRVSEARAALDAERGVAELSMLSPANPIDLTQHDGQLRTREVTISASVQTPEGETVNRNMMIVLQQAEVTDGEETRSGRWVVTAVRDASGPASTS